METAYTFLPYCMASHPDEAALTQGRYLRKMMMKGKEEQEMVKKAFTVLTLAAAATSADNRC
jgi:hypothetical protein